MKALTERLEWIELYLRNSEPTGAGIEKEIAWTTLKELRAISDVLPEITLTFGVDVHAAGHAVAARIMPPPIIERPSN